MSSPSHPPNPYPSHSRRSNRTRQDRRDMEWHNERVRNGNEKEYEHMQGYGQEETQQVRKNTFHSSIHLEFSHLQLSIR